MDIKYIRCCASVSKECCTDRIRNEAAS